MSFWWQLESLFAIFLTTYFHFRSKLRDYFKFVLLNTLVCMFLGGWIQFQTQHAELTVVGVFLLLAVIRFGRSFWIELATVQHTRQLKLGHLSLKGYYDSGNFCREPFSALPVHFIKEDVVKKHPELFEHTSYSTSITTMTTADVFPLMKSRVPLLHQGIPLTDCLFASVQSRRNV